MEVIQVDDTHFVVTFNGVIRTCTFDTDCLGAGICAVNQSWQIDQTQGMCMCNTIAGLDGPTCSDFCSEARLSIAITALGVICAILVIVVSFDYLCQQWKRKRSTVHRAPSTGTSLAAGGPKRRVTTKFVPIILILIFVGGVLMFTSAILTAFIIYGFPWTHVIEPTPSPVDGSILPDRGERRPLYSLDKANTIISAFGQSISITSVVLLPFVWIDSIRFSLQDRQRRYIVFMTIFSFLIVCFIGLQIVYNLFVTSYGRIFVTDSGLIWVITIAVGWQAIFAAVAVLNFLAVLRVTYVMRNVRTRDKIKDVLVKIRTSAILICLLSLVGLGLQIFFYVSGNGYTNRRSLYSDPRCYVDQLSSIRRTRRQFLLLMMIVALWSLSSGHKSVCRLWSTSCGKRTDRCCMAGVATETNTGTDRPAGGRTSPVSSHAQRRLSVSNSDKSRIPNGDDYSILDRFGVSDQNMLARI